MQKRKFGNTGLETTILGFGGYHLLEIPVSEAKRLLNKYLDAGGNYIETAPAYGNGESERKIGSTIKDRRDEYILVTKTHLRDATGCRASVEESLVNLQTDRVDVLLMHGIKDTAELNMILAPDGAYNEALKLKKEGKAGHIGISMHGQPDILIEAINRVPFEVVMATINYYDIHNFPKLLSEFVPLANQKNIGIILMKPVGDGLLYKNAEEAFKYAFSLPVSVVVAGMNNMDMLQMDLDIADNYEKLSDEKMIDISMNAPELGTYVCRRCGKCMDICPKDIDFEELFRLEGLYDRQMRTGIITDTADFALKDRLRFWFGLKERAQQEYLSFAPNGDVCNDCGECDDICPYDINIREKVRLADYKLADKDTY